MGFIILIHDTSWLCAHGQGWKGTVFSRENGNKNNISKTPLFHSYPAHVLCFQLMDHHQKAMASGWRWEESTLSSSRAMCICTRSQTHLKVPGRGCERTTVLRAPVRKTNTSLVQKDIGADASADLSQSKPNWELQKDNSSSCEVSAISRLSRKGVSHTMSALSTGYAWGTDRRTRKNAER